MENDQPIAPLQDDEAPAGMVPAPNIAPEIAAVGNDDNGEYLSRYVIHFASYRTFFSSFLS